MDETPISDNKREKMANIAKAGAVLTLVAAAFGYGGIKYQQRAQAKEEAKMPYIVKDGMFIDRVNQVEFPADTITPTYKTLDKIEVVVNQRPRYNPNKTQ